MISDFELVGNSYSAHITKKNWNSHNTQTTNVQWACACAVLLSGHWSFKGVHWPRSHAPRDQKRDLCYFKLFGRFKCQFLLNRSRRWRIRGPICTKTPSSPLFKSYLSENGRVAEDRHHKHVFKAKMSPIDDSDAKIWAIGIFTKLTERKCIYCQKNSKSVFNVTLTRCCTIFGIRGTFSKGTHFTVKYARYLCEAES